MPRNVPHQGERTHHTGVGALAGGALGALAGGLTGNAIDESEKKQQAQIAAATAAQRAPLGLTDIVNMAQQHISDEVIISQIRTTGSIYHLSPSDIEWLHWISPLRTKKCAPHPPVCHIDGEMVGLLSISTRSLQSLFCANPIWTDLPHCGDRKCPHFTFDDRSFQRNTATTPPGRTTSSPAEIDRLTTQSAVRTRCPTASYC